MIHTLPIPRAGTPWTEDIPLRGTPTEPDRWTATKRTDSGVVVHEVEFHNASIVRGQKARGGFACVVQVKAPAGWTLIEDCRRQLPSVWYPMHAAMRRYAMFPSNRMELAREAAQEASMPYEPTRWGRGRASYGPCNLPLPRLSPQQVAQESAKVTNWLNRLRGLLTTGATGPVEDSQDGLLTPPVHGWRVWGIPERFAHAGSGIFFYTGWEQAPDSPAFSWLKACCNHERWWHAYDRGTGKVVNVDFYGDPGPKYQSGTGDPNNGWLPEFVGVASNPDPLPLPYDAAHSIRGFRELIFLSEATDSPAVKRMLRSVAAQLRLQCSDMGPHPTANYTPPALRTFLGWAKNAPHRGHWGQDTGRQLGWPAYVNAQSVKKAGAKENLPYCEMFAEFAETAAMPNGIVSRCSDSPGSVWYDPQHDTAHAFEVPIFWSGAIGCMLQSGRRIQNPTRFAEVLYEEAPLYPYYSGHGPPQYAYVAQRGGNPHLSVPGGIGNVGDSSHALTGCTLAAALNPSERKRWVNNGHRITVFSDMRESAGIVAQEQL